jgi:hypothetical protein
MPAGKQRSATGNDLDAALANAGVPPEVASQISDSYSEARLVGLRAAMSVLAVLALVALVFTRRIPTRPVGAPDDAIEATV